MMSNHPAYVIEGISIRVFNLSAIEYIFDKHTPVYNNALSLSGFKTGTYFISNTRFMNGLANFRRILR